MHLVEACGPQTLIGEQAAPALEVGFAAVGRLAPRRLRQGELLGLRWSDLSDDYASMTVRHTLDKAGKLADPKTDGSRRSLRPGRVVTAALREQRKRQLEERLRVGTRWKDTGHVFASSIGTPLNGPNVTHEFQAAIARAGLPQSAIPRHPPRRGDDAPRGRRGHRRREPAARPFDGQLDPRHVRPPDRPDDRACLGKAGCSPRG